jgi:hypothetical protein
MVASDEAEAKMAELQEKIDSLMLLVKSKNKIIEGLHETLRKEREAAEFEAWARLTDQEKEQKRKAAEAFADEETKKLINSFAVLLVGNVLRSLTDASDNLAKIFKDCGGMDSEYLIQIEEAYAGFIEQLNIARMSEMS